MVTMQLTIVIVNIIKGFLIILASLEASIKILKYMCKWEGQIS